MPQRVEALIEPKLLVWARRNSGFSVEAAAKRVQVKPDLLHEWENGIKRPTINQLRKLSQAYKRPLAVFYLPEPPTDFQPMRDFRRLHGETVSPESPRLILEIRRARDRREIAIELYELLEGEPPEFSRPARVSDDPEALSTQIRDFLNISLDEQTRLRSDYEKFNWWRSAFERAQILVFQASRVDISEMRGFSISDTPFPAVVVNTKDSPRGRIFTMLHELVHVLLQSGGLCDLHESGLTPEKRVEVFCNRVAGAILVPQDYLLQEDLVSRKEMGKRWFNEEIAFWAERFGASREVILRRLLILNRITSDFYQEKVEELNREYQLAREQRQSGFAPPHRVAMGEAGLMFVRLVFQNYYQANITTSDLSAFLNVKLKQAELIERELMGRSSKFEAAS